MITLYIVRHGNTTFNARGRLQGQTDSPLTNKGVKDAQAIGKMLRKVHFDAIYSSDLSRARRTAEIIQKTLRMHKRIICLKALREIDYGKATGLKKKDAKIVFPYYKKKASFVFPKGESYQQVKKRVVHVIQSIEKKNQSKTILVVTHAGCIRGLLSEFQKKSLEENLSMPISHRFVARIELRNGMLLRHKKISN